MSFPLRTLASPITIMIAVYINLESQLGKLTALLRNDFRPEFLLSGYISPQACISVFTDGFSVYLLQTNTEELSVKKVAGWPGSVSRLTKQ